MPCRVQGKPQRTAASALRFVPRLWRSPPSLVFFATGYAAFSPGAKKPAVAGWFNMHRCSELYSDAVDARLFIIRLNESAT